MNDGPLDLQPMSIGDILDRTVRLYRRDVVRILAIVAMTSVPISAAGWVLRYAEVDEGLTSVAVYILSYLGGNFGLAALTLFVSERFLGRPAGIWAAYRHVLRRVGSLVWVLVLYIVVWTGVPALAVGLAMGLPAMIRWRAGSWAMGAIAIAGIALIPGVVLSVLAFFRLSLVTEVLILEDIRGRAALRRSWRLMRPNTGRAIVILFFWVVVRLILWPVTDYPARALAEASPGPAADAFVVFMGMLAYVLTVPILAIAFILLYYDCRIRQEAFDLEMMARDLGGAPPGPTPITPPEASPAPAPLDPPRQTPAPAPPRAAAASFKVCPTCNAQVPPVRPTCPMCGAAVPFTRR